MSYLMFCATLPILSLLKKNLDYFGADHTVSKIELYRKYQKYLKIWKLDNFETIDEKLNASKNIEKAHKAFTKATLAFSSVFLASDIISQDSTVEEVIAVSYTHLRAHET